MPFDAHPCQWRDRHHRDPPANVNQNIALNGPAALVDHYPSPEIKSLRILLLDLPAQPFDTEDNKLILRPLDLLPLLPYHDPRYDILVRHRDLMGTNNDLLTDLILPLLIFD